MSMPPFDPAKGPAKSGVKEDAMPMAPAGAALGETPDQAPPAMPPKKTGIVGDVEEKMAGFSAGASKATIKAKHIYQTAFAPIENEPLASPGQYHFLRGLVGIQAPLILALVFLTVLTSIMFARQYVYHLVILDREGAPEKIHRLVPLDEPNLTRTAIINMTMNIAAEALTFGFNNAEDRLLQVRRFFTDEAWNDFAAAYLQSGRLDVIKKKQQILTTVATDGAVIIKEGMVHDRYQWVTQVPIIITYLAGQKTQVNRSILQLTLVRVPTTQHPEGVAIDNWKEWGR